MSIDAIQRVKEAEDQAKLLVENAKRKALQIIEEGKEETELKYNEIIAQANHDRERALEDSRKEGNELAMPILERADGESERIRSIKNQDLEKIVDSIVERIVN